MNDDGHIDPALGRLFREEPHPEPRPGARARVLAKLRADLPMLSTAGAEARVDGHRPPATLSRALVARASVAFALGALAGGAGVVALRPAPAERVIYVERPLPSVPPLTPAPPTAPAVPLPALPESAPVSPRAPSDVHPPAPRADDLAEERALLDDARARLASGDANAALQRLDEHARRFSHGKLGEEREALAIQALVNAGRYDEARTRAAAFRKRSPRSVFLSVIDATLESIP